ncbi:DUF2271 domain-containing protein [Stieleria sp. TO1_6]|uniref:DUF2271 domain-containing protein n=1 Tax=Stieleria tagensis TaxID=2956795 RepID=UPI00209A8048|nr:DUF2271 domain-containing protein [Stieleria tagensis]MCO8124886.1 DUF2271 domain-containing protein [Stieleria tagensis]
MKKLIVIALLCLGIGRATVGLAQDDATNMEVGVEIPRLNVSEYHRPYVAVWIQDGNRKVVANLAVWYQMKDSSEGAGTKWLPDLRQWWRRSGRSLDLPVDGVSSATRPAGKHKLSLASDDQRLTKLKPGNYELIVEAAREVGGRELVEIPFTWPTDKSVTHKSKGESELGEVTLTLSP